MADKKCYFQWDLEKFEMELFNSTKENDINNK
jgi:hypothetical protein